MWTACWWAGLASKQPCSPPSCGRRPAAAGAEGEFASVSGFARLREDHSVLTIAIMTLHILVSAALIFLILMHSGKGGGLSDMFGGSVGQAAAGSTAVEKN
ncbi:MAG: preprotein translocase subunit SecG, partial [Acidimicrobiales bacterium]